MPGDSTGAPGGAPLLDKEPPAEHGWPVTEFIPVVSAALPSSVPGKVPGVTGDTGASRIGGNVSEPPGLELNVGGEIGGGLPMAPS